MACPHITIMCRSVLVSTRPTMQHFCTLWVCLPEGSKSDQLPFCFQKVGKMESFHKIIWQGLSLSTASNKRSYYKHNKFEDEIELSTEEQDTGAISSSHLKLLHSCSHFRKHEILWIFTACSCTSYPVRVVASNSCHTAFGLTLLCSLCPLFQLIWHSYTVMFA